MNMDKVPACIGIIMDGNRRWAKAKGLPTLEGHTVGTAKAKEVIRHAFNRGVGTVVIYAFSTENWKRTPEEVEYLMRLFASALKKEFAELVQEGARIRFTGDLDRLPESLRKAAKKAERDSAETNPPDKTLVIALSYGGRAEIVAGVNKLLREGKEVVSEADVSAALWSAGMPDPDLIIRTSGEMRLSNFLPWQSVYSELFFSETLWPAFTTEEFDRILTEFAERERRHGK